MAANHPSTTESRSTGGTRLLMLTCLFTALKDDQFPYHPVLPGTPAGTSFSTSAASQFDVNVHFEHVSINIVRAAVRMSGERLRTSVGKAIGP